MDFYGEVIGTKKEYIVENNHIYVITFQDIISNSDEFKPTGKFNTKYGSNSLCGRERIKSNSFKNTPIKEILDNENICEKCKDILKEIVEV